MTPPLTSSSIFATLLVAILLTGGAYALAGCTPNEPTPPADEPAATETAESDMTEPVASGKASYEAYCASCHGPEGMGNGEVAPDLSTPPADLTQLSINNGGTFPVDAVYQTIDGREDVEAHGPREMPVWGNIWSEEGGDPIAPEVVEQRINELVEYIRSLQE